MWLEERFFDQEVDCAGSTVRQWWPWESGPKVPPLGVCCTIWSGLDDGTTFLAISTSLELRTQTRMVTVDPELQGSYAGKSLQRYNRGTLWSMWHSSRYHVKLPSSSHRKVSNGKTWCGPAWPGLRVPTHNLCTRPSRGRPRPFWGHANKAQQSRMLSVTHDRRNGNDVFILLPSLSLFVLSVFAQSEWQLMCSSSYAT